MSILPKRNLSSYEGQYIVEDERERFTLFYALIPHLKELESCIETRDAAQSRKDQAKGKLERPLLSTFVSAALYTVSFAIPFLIIFYIIVNVIKLDDGKSLYSAYEAWLDASPCVSVVTGWLLSLANIDNFLCNIIAILLSLAFMFVIVPCLYFLFPIVFVLCTISTIFTRRTAKKDLKESAEICKEMDLNIEQLVNLLAVPLQAVPLDYQYSEALEYFCNSYMNGRVHTLQEAITTYDTYLHRRKMEHAQEVIHDDQTMILEGIHDQQRKLDRLQDIIKRVKSKVDWL